MQICSQDLLSVPLVFCYENNKNNGNRSVPSKFMSSIEYVITTDVIKSFVDCIVGSLYF